MPELLTKYPDTVIQILHESGAHCGADVPRQILVSCPPESFCSLPTGEVCIYGLSEVHRMTQMTPLDVVKASSGKSLLLSPEVLITVFLIFTAGALFGNFLSRWKK